MSVSNVDLNTSWWKLQNPDDIIVKSQLIYRISPIRGCDCSSSLTRLTGCLCVMIDEMTCIMFIYWWIRATQCFRDDKPYFSTKVSIHSTLGTLIRNQSYHSEGIVLKRKTITNNPQMGLNCLLHCALNVLTEAIDVSSNSDSKLGWEINLVWESYGFKNHISYIHRLILNGVRNIYPVPLIL